MSAILLTDSSGRPYDPSFMAAAQQSPVRGHINPMECRQKFVLTGEAGRIVRQKMRWPKANSYGAIATRVGFFNSTSRQRSESARTPSEFSVLAHGATVPNVAPADALTLVIWHGVCLLQRLSSVFSPSSSAGFQPTRWSLVVRAAYQKRAGDPDMEEFCRIYWYPLFAAARRLNLGPVDACDAVQELFADLIARDLLRRADPSRGRLRSWLITLLRNRVNDHARAARAAKRGGGEVPFSLDAMQAEAAFTADPAMHDDPDTAYRRSLAASLLDDAVESLVSVYAAKGKADLCEALLPALEGPLPDATWDETGTRLGMSGGALRMAVVRFRERFRRILREKAAHVLGVADGPELDRELRDVLGRGP